MKRYLMLIPVMFITVNLFAQTVNSSSGDTSVASQLDLLRLTEQRDSIMNIIKADSVVEAKRRILPVNDQNDVAIAAYQIIVTPLTANPNPGPNPNQGNPVNSSEAKDSKSQVTIVMSFKEFSSLDSLFLKYGSYPDLGDIFALSMSCNQNQNQNFLLSKDTRYDLTGTVARISFSAYDFLLKNKTYLSVKGKKKDGTFTSYFIK